MSRIPLARGSTLTVQGANLPRPSKVSGRRLGESKVGSEKGSVTRSTPGIDIFISAPTMQAMDSRSVPKELSGKPRIYGNVDQSEKLYNYTRTLAQQIFTPNFCKILFPNGLSAMKSVVIGNFQMKRSKIPLARKPTEVKSEIQSSSGQLQLTDAFESLKKLVKIRRSQILAITDFCLLYVAVILLVCERDDLLLPALYFLKHFLHIGIPQRSSEIGIVFALLVRQGNADAKIRGHVIDILAQLAGISEDIYARLQTGSSHHDVVLAALCAEAIERIPMPGNTDRAVKPPQFAEIPVDCPQQTAVSMLSTSVAALRNGQVPPDPISLIRSVIRAMSNFGDSAAVIENGASCLHLTCGLCESLPLEFVAQMLEICVAVLCGCGDETGAVQSLFDALFRLPAEMIITGASSVIAQTKGEYLPFLLGKVKEYVESSPVVINPRLLSEMRANLDAFHPSFAGNIDFLGASDGSPYDAMALSVKRLMDADTVFEEMEAIIGSRDPSKLDNYPLYLRSFLQRAYVLYTREVPRGMSEWNRNLADRMIQAYDNMKPEDVIGDGEYSIDTLSKKLESLRHTARMVSTW
jgi:hypothetical protein